MYADCLEQMKGQRPLIFYSNGHRTWLWDDRRAPPREVQGFYPREELELAVQRRSLQQDLKGLKVHREIAGREYQIRAVRAMTESLASGRLAGMLTMTSHTGSPRVWHTPTHMLQPAHQGSRTCIS